MTPFDRLALKYDRWYEQPFGSSAYRLELECLKSLTGKFKLGLEVGVGTGRFAGALGIQVGIDPSLEMLRFAQKRGIRCVQGVGENLPFRKGSFDLVLMVVTICFVKDPFGVLKETKRVLKDRGRLVLGLIPAESLWADFYREKARNGHPIYRHVRFYPLSYVKEILKEAGFENLHIKSTLLEEPQDEREVRNREVVEGFDPRAGFTCILAT